MFLRRVNITTYISPTRKARNSRFYPELYASPEVVLVYTNYKSQGQRYLDPISSERASNIQWKQKTSKCEISLVKGRASDCQKASASPSWRTLKAPIWLLSSKEGHFSCQLHGRGRFTGTETWLKSVIKEIDSMGGRKSSMFAIFVSNKERKISAQFNIPFGLPSFTHDP